MQLWDRISKPHYHKHRALFTHTHKRLLNLSAHLRNIPCPRDPNWNISLQFPNQFGNHEMSPFKLFWVFTLMFWMSFWVSLKSYMSNFKFQLSVLYNIISMFIVLYEIVSEHCVDKAFLQGDYYNPLIAY